MPSESNVSYQDVLELPVASPVRVINYAQGDLQYAELWRPKGSFNNKGGVIPLVVFVHGGCWLSDYDIKHSHAFSSALANSGYAVWSIEYRRTGDEGGGWPNSLNDIKLALDYLQDLDAPGINTKQYALTGHSAGGHLALLAGIGDKNALSVIGLAAIADIEQYAGGSNSCQSATHSFMGGTPDLLKAEYDRANPARQSLNPNTQLIYGDEDAIVPITQAQSSNLRLTKVNGAGHFDFIHPGTLAFQTLLKELANIYP